MPNFSSVALSGNQLGAAQPSGLEAFVGALLSSQQQAQQMQAQKQQQQMQQQRFQQEQQLFPLQLQQAQLDLQKSQQVQTNTFNLSDTANSMGFGGLLPQQYSKVTYGLGQEKDANQVLIGIVPLEDKNKAAELLGLENLGKTAEAEKQIKDLIAKDPERAKRVSFAIQYDKENSYIANNLTKLTIDANREATSRKIHEDHDQVLLQMNELTNDARIKTNQNTVQGALQRARLLSSQKLDPFTQSRLKTITTNLTSLEKEVRSNYAKMIAAKAKADAAQSIIDNMEKTGKASSDPNYDSLLFNAKQSNNALQLLVQRQQQLESDEKDALQQQQQIEDSWKTQTHGFDSGSDTSTNSSKDKKITKITLPSGMINAVNQVAKKYNVNPKLMLAVIQSESGGNLTALGDKDNPKKGASSFGLGQENSAYQPNFDRSKASQAGGSGLVYQLEYIAKQLQGKTPEQASNIFHGLDNVDPSLYNSSEEAASQSTQSSSPKNYTGGF